MTTSLSTDPAFSVYDGTESVVNDRILLIDKPAGITSFDVIRQLRRSTGIRKIGHAGTLDPIATGLLVCMTGKATKASRSIMAGTKVYTGACKLGEETPSYDTETEVTRSISADHITKDMLVEASQELVGQRVQLTPVYSAVKVDGKPLYKYAREGKSVTRPPRIVDVHSFDITGLEGTIAHFHISCSAGTYVRTLVHDLGQLLKVGAHMTALRRIEVGQYHIDDAQTLDHFKSTEGDR